MGNVVALGPDKLQAKAPRPRSPASTQCQTSTTVREFTQDLFLHDQNLWPLCNQPLLKAASGIWLLLRVERQHRTSQKVSNLFARPQMPLPG